MNVKPSQGGALLSLIAVAALSAGGCGQADNKGSQARDNETLDNGKTTKVAETRKGDDHSGWWCAEHGVPEEICGQCNAKVAAEFKKKGDWCKDHDRPESQCFICHPEKREQFAAQYRARYGKEPPPLEDEPRAP